MQDIKFPYVLISSVLFGFNFSSFHISSFVEMWVMCFLLEHCVRVCSCDLLQCKHSVEVGGHGARNRLAFQGSVCCQTRPLCPFNIVNPGHTSY
jgi:hypothetical protein